MPRKLRVPGAIYHVPVRTNSGPPSAIVHMARPDPNDLRGHDWIPASATRNVKRRPSIYQLLRSDPNASSNQQDVNWWGPGGRVAADDLDNDVIPDYMEHDLTVCEGGPFDCTRTQTYPDTRIENDCERNAVFTQDVWTVGSADLEDWSNTGNQH
jgi:hypothetical protein